MEEDKQKNKISLDIKLGMCGVVEVDDLDDLHLAFKSNRCKLTMQSNRNEVLVLVDLLSVSCFSLPGTVAGGSRSMLEGSSEALSPGQQVLGECTRKDSVV